MKLRACQASKGDIGRCAGTESTRRSRTSSASPGINRRRQAAILVMLVAMAVPTLTGCGSGEPGEAKPPPSESEPRSDRVPAASRTSWSGAKVYDEVCDLCHKMGVEGAPIVGDRAAWSARIEKGEAVLFRHVKQGFNKMPARGRCEFCSDEQLGAAMRHMIANSR